MRELSPWLREVFESGEFRQRPYFRADLVIDLLNAHANGTRNCTDVLWRCLAVELWHRAMRI